MRYLVAGAGVTALYSLIVTCLIISELIKDPTFATVASSIIVAPVSFLAHRKITYPDVSHDPAHWKRFAALTIASFAIVTTSMKIVDLLHGPFWVGLVLGWIVVPLANFAINTIWVFRTRSILALSDTRRSDPNTENFQ